jgi:hypothetical protein
MLSNKFILNFIKKNNFVFNKNQVITDTWILLKKN